MTFPIEAFGDIVIAEQETEEVTTGGIILATDESKKLRYGKVVAVGDGYRGDAKYNMQNLRVGDRIVFGKYQSGGEPIRLKDGKEYLLFRIGDLVGKDVA